MKTRIGYVWILLALMVLFQISCRKSNLDPNNQLSYKIGLKNYKYSYYESPQLFGGYYRSIKAENYTTSFVIYANYTAYTHNTLNFYFNKDNLGLLQSVYSVEDPMFFVTLDDYKGAGGNFYILDPRYKKGFVKFTHISEKYVEGTFDFKMVKSDANDLNNIDYSNTIHLKKGQFKIQIY